uniref:Uncharacterized protein n=1 Tax=Setaria viridis TaxID=4556 RepID=A0A4U6USM1_SETVI|nr:NDR1/HIN1-like protein 10 [Setaria viridis]TKW19480.1 hypothetical protein SEVIR_4G022700v2 [Setaria viridis]
MSGRSNNAVEGSGGRPLGSVCGGLFQRAHEFVKDLWAVVRDLIQVLKEYSPVFKCLASCCQCAWGCLELWTPLSVTFIMYWLIYRPDHFHPRIDSAVLATLDLTNATIRYDLAVDLSFRNTRRVAIRYLDVAASVFYNDNMLGPTDDPLPSFFHGPKNTTIFHPTFHGVVPVDPAVAAELQREIEAGTVHIRVTVSLTLMYKVLFVRDVFFYKYDCWLWFPPPRNHTPALFPGNGGTKCWRV